VLVAFGTSLSMLSPGMALGFSAVALPQLAEEISMEPFNEDKSSWFGKYFNNLNSFYSVAIINYKNKIFVSQRVYPTLQRQSAVYFPAGCWKN